MHQYTIAQLEALVAAGQGKVERASHDGSRHVSYRPPLSVRRDIRCEIYNVVCGAGREMTRTQIAKRMDLKPATWINKHIEQLVRDGYLVRSEQPYRPGIMQYLYEVAR